MRHTHRLFADRTSAATMRANQLRLYFSSLAYTLLQTLRRLGLKGTALAKAQCDTIRLKLLKLAAHVSHRAKRLGLVLTELSLRRFVLRGALSAARPSVATTRSNHHPRPVSHLDEPGRAGYSLSLVACAVSHRQSPLSRSISPIPKQLIASDSTNAAPRPFN